MNAAMKDVRVIRNSLYIEPISSCNLHCRMCYANVDGQGFHLSTTIASCLSSGSYVDFAAVFFVGGVKSNPKGTEVPSKIVIRQCQKMALGPNQFQGRLGVRDRLAGKSKWKSLLMA